jgi:hypothetical protein
MLVGDGLGRPRPCVMPAMVSACPELTAAAIATGSEL